MRAWRFWASLPADRVKFGIYAGQVVTDVQIYSAGEKPEIGEVVYEERDGRKVPVGKRYLCSLRRQLCTF